MPMAHHSKTSFLSDDWRGFKLVRKVSSESNPNSPKTRLNNPNGHPPQKPSVPRLYSAAQTGGSSMAAALLGEDGRGYELARILDACGAWRTWLGEAAYAVFLPALSSPSTWDVFLSPRVAGAGSAPPVRAQIQLQLQLRARALLYDKASASLFLSQSHSINDINPNFLQLHGDDVYFSLDEEKEDGSQLQSQSAFNTDSSNPTSTTKWPNTWYKQFAEKFRIRHHKLPSGEKEITKRTPEGMLTYLKLSTVHKRKRQVFKDYQSPGDPISLTDETLFPEMFFPADCVPDSALPKADCTPKRAKPEFHTVLDNLPSLPTRSPAMIERFGILPEYYKSGPKSLPTKALSPEQENLLAKKAVVRLVLSVGFEGGSGGAVEVLGEVVGRKGRELGKMLRVLSDGYRKECSSVELLKMFLKVSGYSIGGLAEITKCGNNNSNNNNNHNRALSHQMQQQHSHSLQSQHQNNIFNAQQRQFHPHAQIQNLAFHQQQQQLQQQQQQQQQIQQQIRRNNNNNNNNNTNNNNQMKTHNPLVDVKIENSAQMDLAQHQMDGFGGNNNTINNNNNVNNSGRNQQQLQLQQQLRFQQHQMMMVNNNNSNININNNIVQSGPQQQFKPMQSVQISQLQAQNVYGMRPAPVKVEAFHELVSGDNEHSKMLTSPK